MLNIYTTHLKEGYLRRNGLPRSDKATFTEHWVRHGNYLTVTTVITDPAFLTEPLTRSQTWVLDPGQQLGKDFCEYVPEIRSPPTSCPIICLAQIHSFTKWPTGTGFRMKRLGAAPKRCILNTDRK